MKHIQLFKKASLLFGRQIVFSNMGIDQAHEQNNKMVELSESLIIQLHC